MSFESIAEDLRDGGRRITLIYAFNSTGKTRLSVAYKDATKDEEGLHAGVYYNAFSEDLFVWKNDEENDGLDVHLNVLPSSLNQFHSFLTEGEGGGAVAEKLAPFQPKYDFVFDSYSDSERGIESVRFYAAGDNDRSTPIKISRGEERIFVWCFFLALLDVEGWADEQDAHIFIDDPVSSLDEHNIFITAETIFGLIEDNYRDKNIILTTHHVGLLSILSDRLKKGEKSDRYKNLTDIRILTERSDEACLISARKDVMLYHLRLLQELKATKNGQLYRHHMVLLRQILENIASFLGVGRTSFVLEQIGIQDTDGTMQIIKEALI